MFVSFGDIFFILFFLFIFYLFQTVPLSKNIIEWGNCLVEFSSATIMVDMKKSNVLAVLVIVSMKLGRDSLGKTSASQILKAISVRLVLIYLFIFSSLFLGMYSSFIDSCSLRTLLGFIDCKKTQEKDSRRKKGLITWGIWINKTFRQ